MDRPQTATETLQSKEEAERMEKLGLAPGQEKPTRKPGSTDEFTDQEIEDAFAFIDLDRNRFLGAGRKTFSFFFFFFFFFFCSLDLLLFVLCLI